MIQNRFIPCGRSTNRSHSSLARFRFSITRFEIEKFNKSKYQFLTFQKVSTDFLVCASFLSLKKTTVKEFQFYLILMNPWSKILNLNPLTYISMNVGMLVRGCSCFYSI